MEKDELQRLWETGVPSAKRKSEVELDFLLTSKAKQMVNKFLVVIGTSVFVSLGVLFFLFIAAINRQNDPLYLIHNITLGVVVLISFFSGIFAWHRLQNNASGESVKKWLETNIKLLSNSLSEKSQKLSVFLLPFINALVILSIHVYFENKLYVEVLQTEESIIGLIVGYIVGLVVAFYVFRKIRSYQLANLGFLTDLYNKICNLR